MINRLTIIGLGLLGGSIGLAVKKHLSHCQVTGCAHRDGSLKAAKETGAIRDWTLDPAIAVREADLVILCTPVSRIPQWIERIAPHLKPGAIVTDVGSTKTAIVEAGERLIRSPAHFVGSHPMAGSEQKGVAVARADLFADAACIVTHTTQTDPIAADAVEAFWQTLGCRIVRHTPVDHDRLVALVSHLPHAVASALVAVQETASLDLHGRGFLDSTRIAAGDPELWRDIFIENRGNLVSSIDLLTRELFQLSSLLKMNDARAIQEWLAKHALRRSKL
ncbi:MAG: prephenate dehydrogenase [Burkholderiales bacterium]|nr:prephenate dehydrogenase [Phycisphaerae bacterium]